MFIIVDKMVKNNTQRNPVLQKLVKEFNLMSYDLTSPIERAVYAEDIANLYHEEAEKAAKAKDGEKAKELLNKSVDYWIIASELNLGCGNEIPIKVKFLEADQIENVFIIECSEDRKNILDALRLLNNAASLLSSEPTLLNILRSDKTISSTIEKIKDSRDRQLFNLLSMAGAKYNLAAKYVEETDLEKARILQEYADKLRLAASQGRLSFPWYKITITETKMQEDES